MSIESDNIPGLDPAAVSDARELLRPDILFITGFVLPGQGEGGLTVVKGEVKEAKLDQLGRPRAKLGNVALTDVICEQTPNNTAPSSRQGVTYGRFEIRDAHIFQLENGGRLLAVPKPPMPHVHLRYGQTRGVYTGEEPVDVSRIVYGMEEAHDALAGIGAYLGLGESDATLLADVGLDFSGQLKGMRGIH